MSEKRDLCWLARPVEGGSISTYFIEGDSPIVGTIKKELPRLIQGIAKADSREAASLVFELSGESELGKEGYRIEGSKEGYAIKGASEAALLYGMFGFHRLLLTEENGHLPYQSVPDQEIRMLNHWDNFDGTIERGYAGDSIFYDNEKFRGDMGLVEEYARLLASVGLNSISINNVNVRKLASFFVTDSYLVEIKKIVDVFAAYGMKTYISINFAAPKIVGGLSTADPLDADVAAWWKKTADGIYNIIPNFAGFVVKADSEGEPGPFAYGRNHDDGANMLADALAPHGGWVIWRCFVYNHKQDWRDRSLDRARAAYDLFKDLDGNFKENVILQVKNGPIDFQIREPISPLFGALEKTNQILEFQVTQEYTGHQIDICYLVPMWKEVLDFDPKYPGKGKVKDLLKTDSPERSKSGIAAVGIVGMDANWTGNKMAQANLYGYGRLIWDNELTSEEIAKEWVRLSFVLDEEDETKVEEILLTSRKTYEDYTNPLSVGFMCVPHLHYGVMVDGYEYDKWGTYHYADRYGIGRDRTIATGTGYVRQYSDAICAEYDSLETCPDELLLFFHHVPYTHVLHSGKTVIQHIYDTHFEGFEKVEEYRKIWDSLKDVLDAASYENVRERLERQEQNAIDWKDQVNTYFFRKSGIADEKNRTIYE